MIDRDYSSSGHVDGNASTTARTQDPAAIDNLRRLGIDISTDDIDRVEHEPTPEEQAGFVLEGLNKQEISNFITVETLRQHLVGLHSCDLYIGKAKVSVTVQGLDVFELLPELPNMMQVQQENAVKPTRNNSSH